jgi:hypothetical protein
LYWGGGGCKHICEFCVESQADLLDTSQPDFLEMKIDHSYPMACIHCLEGSITRHQPHPMQLRPETRPTQIRVLAMSIQVVTVTFNDVYDLLGFKCKRCNFQRSSSTFGPPTPYNSHIKHTFSILFGVSPVEDHLPTSFKNGQVAHALDCVTKFAF